MITALVRRVASSGTLAGGVLCMFALGIVTKGRPVLQPSVSSHTPPGNPTKASITDCFDNTPWIECKTNGTLPKNTPGGRRSTTADLVRMGSTWKVTELTIRATGTC